MEQITLTCRVKMRINSEADLSTEEKQKFNTLKKIRYIYVVGIGFMRNPFYHPESTNFK